LGRRKSAFSQRGKKDLREEFELLLDTLHLAHKSLREKLAEKHSLRDQEFRTLEHIPELITRVENLLRGLKDEEDSPVDMTERMKKIIKMFEREFALVGELTPEQRDVIFKETGYYRCVEICGELHSIGSECPFVLRNKELKSANDSEALED
jgi:hypothetical protein